MTFRNTIGLIALCSSLFALAGAEPKTFLEAVETVRGEVILGAVGLSGASQPERWLVLTRKEYGVLREVAVSEGRVTEERIIEPLPGQDLPDIPIDFERVAIDSIDAFHIVSKLAKQKKVEFDSARFHLRCRDAGKEPVWLLKLLGPVQDPRGLVYLSAVTGEVLRTAWTVREIDDFASVSPTPTRTDP